MNKQALMLTKKLAFPGDHGFFFSGKVGQLEAVLSVPAVPTSYYVAILGHPHSLHLGTMNNKVVTTMARIFSELGIPSIRFNFRGVGQSRGVFDEGIGESHDMQILAHLVLQEMPAVQLIFAGFSFGSYVTYRVAAHCRHALLISIAPPVHHYNFTEFSLGLTPWIIALGDVDEIVPAQLVREFANQIKPSPSLLLFKDTGHFFHGKLVELKHRMMEAVRMQLDAL